MLDSLREIISTIRKNKLRTFLTGCAVAWGIFMLIVLLASGNGLKNGVMSNFSDRATNAVTVWPGWTSMPYNGLPSDRRIRFDHKDWDLITTKIPEVEYATARISQTATITYEKEYGSWSLEGASQDAAYIRNIRIKNGLGRFINRQDVMNRRKVIVINTDIQKVLFNNENPIGKYVNANNIAYQVVGVYDDENQYQSAPPAYIPFTTAQMLYNKGYGFRQIEFTVLGLNTLEANEAFNTRLREKFAALHGFDPADRSAIYIWNTAENAIQTANVFNMINIFILIVGIASLMAGIVGVGNIMLITVKERTREIGIRKAIGATPASILRLIIFEAIFITTCAGYVGIVAGVGLSELVSRYLSQNATPGRTVFLDPTVDLGTVIGATVFLIVCGIVAGLIPALKATRVKPIEAMRAE